MKSSLYFHLPFCTKKCPYCHFYVVPNRKMYHKLLQNALHTHFHSVLPQIEGRDIVSIYLGGGTPSLFTRLQELLDPLPKSPSCEITIEANPEEASLDLFSSFISLGINRLSLGVQSLDDRSLQTLGRLHSAQKAKKAILDAEKAGFQNISIDLMYDLPNQTENSWEYTLDQLQDLPIQHLSLYNLTIEPHTSFYKQKVKLPDPELSLSFLTKALKSFEKKGLHRYEISAFAKKGFESVHNLGYWTGREFLGFGPSAFSYWGGRRFQNVCNLHRYARDLKEGASAICFEEKLPYPSNIKELFAIHLRLTEGVSLNALPYPDLPTLEKLLEQKLLKQKKKQIQLTEKGMLFYDTVASELIDFKN